MKLSVPQIEHFSLILAFYPAGSGRGSETRTDRLRLPAGLPFRV